MPRGPGRLDVQRVSVPQLERAARQQNNIRVGATTDPLSRARSYEQNGANGHYFVGRYLYTAASNARQVEDHLLRIARQCGNARLNLQGRSNYGDTRGYVYVILGRLVAAPVPAARRHAAPTARGRGRGGGAAAGGRSRGHGAARRPVPALRRPPGVQSRQRGGGGGILTAIARAFFG